MLRTTVLLLTLLTGGFGPAQSIASLTAPLSSGDPAVREAGLLEFKALLDESEEMIESAGVVELIGLFLEAELKALQSGAAENDDRLRIRYPLIAPYVLRALDRSAPLPPAFLRAAVHSSYLIGGDHSRTFAQLGPPILPFLTEMTNSRPSAKTAAYDILGKMLQEGRVQSLRTPLTPATEAGAKQVIRGGLQDPDPYVRKAAIRAVVDARDLDAIPILTLLAATDPDTGRFPVRAEAAGAIKRLQQ